MEVVSEYANRELETKVNILYGIQLPFVLNDTQSRELEEAQHAREDWERQARELAGQLQRITEEKDENVREHHQYETQTKTEIERLQGLVKEAERTRDNLNSLNSQPERRLHENEEDSQHSHREEEDRRKAEKVALLLSELRRRTKTVLVNWQRHCATLNTGKRRLANLARRSTIDFKTYSVFRTRSVLTSCQWHAWFIKTCYLE